jgi:hypothetical protein
MKTIFARVKPAALLEGDEIRICYTASRGGCTEAGYKVKKEDLWRPIREGETYCGGAQWIVQPDPNQPAETRVPCSPEELAEAIAEKLKDAIARVWSGELFKATRRKNELVLTCGHDDQTFFPMLNGTQQAGEEVIEIETL